MTVGEMLSRMTSAELTEWGVFFKLEAADMEAMKNGAGKPGGGGSQDFPGVDAMMAKSAAENN
jgi:hypothetical protein